MKPYIKKIDILFERIFAGNKFEITSTEVLLMAIVIMLIATTIESADPARNKVIVKTVPATSSTSSKKAN